MATPAITSPGVQTTDLLGPFTLYLEGIRIKYATMSIVGTEGSYTGASVTVPFDRAGLIRKIRPKTFGQIWFGDRLFLLFEGELVQKSYTKTPVGPGAVTLSFTGIAGNLATMKYAMLSPEQGGAGLNVGSPSLATAAAIYLLSGFSVGTQVSTEDQVNLDKSIIGYKGASIQRDLIGTRFEKALGESPNTDMAKAFREIINAFIYGAETPDDKTGINVVGAVAASSLGIANSRFGLVKSLVGATNNELLEIFYAKKVPGGDINPFVSTVLGIGITGEQDLMRMLKTVAYRAYHTITEMIAPPMTQDASGSPALGRLMMIPRLFSADPPICNVFLPQVTSGIDSNVTALKTTRLIVQQNNLVSDAIPTASIGISPDELSQKLITKSGKTTSLSFATAITQEETEVGVLTAVVPDVFGASMQFAGNPSLLADWFKKTGPLRFASMRTEQQTMSIVMEFNPFVAIGFPGLVFDEDLGVIRGMVISLQHNITASGAMTVVGMAYCVHEDDALEYQGYPDTNFDTGFGGKLNTYKAGKTSDIYEKVLGCKSLFKARLDAAADGADAAARKRISDEEEAVRNGTSTSTATSSTQQHFDDIKKEELDKANAAAQSEGVSAQARKLFESIASKSSSAEAEKEAVRAMAIRNIASYEDLQRFYALPGMSFVQPGATEAEKNAAAQSALATEEAAVPRSGPLATPTTASSKEHFDEIKAGVTELAQVTQPPFSLNLKLPYASLEQHLKVTNKSSSGSVVSEYVVASAPAPLQVFDRVAPVLAYAKSIEE